MRSDVRAKTAADCIVMRAIRRRGETTCDHCADPKATAEARFTYRTHRPDTDGETMRFISLSGQNVPVGPTCGKPAHGVIFWSGHPRRYSSVCSEHVCPIDSAGARDLVLVYLPF